MNIYSIKNDDTIGQWLTMLKKSELVIPALQRPFVWGAPKVCSLIESLYLGYPIGFFVFAEKPDIALKTGGTSTARSFLVIDGHQRVMSLQAALLGEKQKIFDKKYQQLQTTIAFHPVREIFEVSKKQHKDPKSGWIADISKLFKDDFDIFTFVTQYCETVPDAINNVVAKRLEQLRQIRNHYQGVFVVESNTSLQTISDLFYRLNRMGVTLKAADFIMAALCSNVDEEGDLLREAIDHFCYLVHPSFNEGNLLKADEDSKFTTSEYYEKMSWLKKWKEKRIFYFDYTNVLWIISARGLGMGGSKGIKEIEELLVRASDSEVSEAFRKLKTGFLEVVDEINFNRFVMILRNLGFTEMVSPRALTCSYILYLTLRALRENTDKIESLVGRWYVMSILTNRTTVGAPDATLRKDIAGILKESVKYADKEISNALSKDFWVKLPSGVEKITKTGDNFAKIYLASHINAGDKGFLSKKLTVQNLLEGKKNNHHLFPVNHLVNKLKITETTLTNSFANMVITQQEHNIKISDTDPFIYLREMLEQGKTSFAEICGTELKDNLVSHCIPTEIDILKDYEKFIEERAKLMVRKVKKYFESL